MSTGPDCELNEPCSGGGEGRADDIVSLAVASAIVGVLGVAVVQRLLGDD